MMKPFGLLQMQPFAPQPVPQKPGMYQEQNGLMPPMYDPSMDAARFPVSGQGFGAGFAFGQPYLQNPGGMMFDHEMGINNPRPAVPMNPSAPAYPPGYFGPRQQFGQDGGLRRDGMPFGNVGRVGDTYMGAVPNGSGNTWADYLMRNSDPNTMRTADFQDSGVDGVDARDMGLYNQWRGTGGTNMGQGRPSAGGNFLAPMQIDFLRQLFSQMRPQVQRGMQKPMMF